MKTTRSKFVALVVLACLVTTISACTADPGTQLSLPAAGATLAPGVAAADASIGEVLAARGYACVRTANILRRPLTDQDLEGLASAASKVAAAGGWLAPGKDVLAEGQAFVGSVEAAAKAVGGEVVGSASDRWVLTTRGGEPFAFQLEAVELPGGGSVWIVGDRMRPAACP